MYVCDSNNIMLDKYTIALFDVVVIAMNGKV